MFIVDTNIIIPYSIADIICHLCNTVLVYYVKYVYYVGHSVF